MTELSRTIAALPPAVRRVICVLAQGEAELTRKAALLALSGLSLAERGGMSLDRGKVLVSDLARSMRHVRDGKVSRCDSSSPRKSARADGRARFASRLTSPLRMRSRWRSRALIKEAAVDALLPYGRPDLVYEVADANVGVRCFRADFLPGPTTGFVSCTLLVPVNWKSQIMMIGDGTGRVGSRFILSAKLLARVEGEPHAIYEAVLVGALTDGSTSVTFGYVTTGARGATAHPSFSSACDALEAVHGREAPGSRLELVRRKAKTVANERPTTRSAGV